jgi:hypothetical protein
MIADIPNEAMNLSVEPTATEWPRDAMAGIRKQRRSFASSFVSFDFGGGCLVIRRQKPRMVRAAMPIRWYSPGKGVHPIKMIVATLESLGR